MRTLLKKLIADRRGASALVFISAFVATIGSTAFVVDVGQARVAQRMLQASSDAAALAGAGDILTGGATGTAIAYSSAPGAVNASNAFTARMAPGFPRTKCLASTGISCSNPSNANAITVRQEADVPMTFGRILGFNNWRITATSTAGLSGGAPVPLEVLVILDMTGSMNDPNRSCSATNNTKIGCALAGARAMIGSMSPVANRVGLYGFPGALNATEAARNYNCSTDVPRTVSYGANPRYEILPLGNDFRQPSEQAQGEAGLDTNSNLVRALKGGPTNCRQGITAPGGQGTFYADAITAAQARLVATARADTERVIVILSDGDATAIQSRMPVGRHLNQCRQAIAAATAAKAAGTKIYSIAYGAPTSSASSCLTDTTNRISACDAMRQIASSEATFFAGNDGGSQSGCSSGANNITDVVNIFRSIGSSFQQARLVPNTMT